MDEDSEPNTEKSDQNNIAPSLIAAQIDTLTKTIRLRIQQSAEQHIQERTYRTTADRRARATLRWTRSATVLVALYTVITMGLAIVGAFQLGVSRDTERRQLRAYIGIVPGQVEGISDAPIGNFIQKNYGLTPAYLVGIDRIEGRILKNKTIFALPMPGCARPRERGLTSTSPTMELPLKIKIPNITQEQIDNVVYGSDYMFLFDGEICYFDAFGFTHFTHFCWKYHDSSMNAKDADACMEYNDSN